MQLKTEESQEENETLRYPKESNLDLRGVLRSFPDGMVLLGLLTAFDRCENGLAGLYQALMV